MNTIAQRLNHVKQEIADAARRFNRSPADIQLLAVSKTRPVANILQAIAQKHYAFGENYLQEALPKIQALQDYDLEWHFIGGVQSNKTRLIAENFDWVQSVDNLKQAQRLNVQRPTHLPPLNICIQINIDAEPQKSGVLLNELFDLAQAIDKLHNLRLRGIMSVPAFHTDFAQQRQTFLTLHEAYIALQNQGFKQLDTLSIGMTQDMAAAIAEGSTLVRIGTGIFGHRTKNQ